MCATISARRGAVRSHAPGSRGRQKAERVEWEHHLTDSDSVSLELLALVQGWRSVSVAAIPAARAPTSCAIGLASAHRIITRHGGQISAPGEVGHSTTVTFTLEPNPQPLQPHDSCSWCASRRSRADKLTPHQPSATQNACSKTNRRPPELTEAPLVGTSGAHA